MNWPGFRDQMVTAMAGAAILGGGGTIISNKVAIGQLDARVSSLESIATEMRSLRAELQQTREELIRSQRR